MKSDNQTYTITIKDVDINRRTLKLVYGDKEICITMASISNKLKEQDKNGCCRAGKLLFLINDNVLLGNTGHNALIYFKYQIGTHIINARNDYVITGIFLKKDKYSNRKFYNMHCNKCGWDGYISEHSIDENRSCQCCSKEVIVSGINDIATTDKWAINYFVNKSDIFNYHNSSNSIVTMVCPICGQIYRNINIRNFFNNIHHLNCPCHKTYASYPERFIFNMLKMLKVDGIIPQASRKNIIWADNFRYDFYILNKSCIIETHGIQHYSDSFQEISGRKYNQEQQNDYEKEILAKQNGIQHYIILDCRKSTINQIKTSVMNSELPRILSFSEQDINWHECDKKSKSELLIDVCTTYMKNITSTKLSLSQQFGLKPDTIRRYLIEGRKLSICDFDAYSIREKLSNHIINSVIFIYKNGVLIRVCTSVVDIHKKSLDIFGSVISERKIIDALQNKTSINGYTIIRDASIDSYEKYIDFLCNYF